MIKFIYKKGPIELSLELKLSHILHAVAFVVMSTLALIYATPEAKSDTLQSFIHSVENSKELIMHEVIIQHEEGCE